MTTQKKPLLNQTEWDFCVIGNGVAALWAAHHAWASKRSVLWIGDDDAFSPARALCSHAWLWGLSAEDASSLREILPFDLEAATSYETVYFDARASKRLRPLSEVKLEWGEHEKAYFQAINENASVDLWNLQAQLYSFHASREWPQTPSTIEAFSEPRFVRLHRWPVQFIETNEGCIRRVGIGSVGEEPLWVTARQFVFTDSDTNFGSLLSNEAESSVFSGVQKGRSSRPGFGLSLRHKNLENILSQTVVVPLTVNPEKGKASHVIGRFTTTPRGIESHWAGFLTDEEVEDNNEILKKIKQAKRAIDRALPGFSESIEREAVTFEPRMHSVSSKNLSGSSKHDSQGTSAAKQALGAWILSDQFGLEPLVKGFVKCLTQGESARIPVQSSMPSTLEAPQL